MAIFYYKSINDDGESTEGRMTADHQKEVVDRLQNSGHVPIEIKAIEKDNSKKKYKLPILFSKSTVRARDIILFTREFATLSNAGLPIDQALKTLEDLSEHEPVRNLIGNINRRIQEGETLSSAMEAQGKIFNKIYLNTIRAGEAGGSLGIVLTRLADYLDSTAELRSNVISTLLYPAILCIVAICSIFFLLIFVIPQFVALFEDLGQALPFLTQVVFWLADITKRFWWLLIGGGMLCAWFVNWRWQDPEVQLRWDKFCLRLPLYGDLVTKLEVARFSRTLGVLLTNGVPLLKAVSIVREVFVNRVLASVIHQVLRSLEQGQGIAVPLKSSGFFPPLIIQLIQVGEQTGDLENMLLKAADVYDVESRTVIKRLLTLIEPAIILGMGAVISLIIVSVLLAMLGLNDLIV